MSKGESVVQAKKASVEETAKGLLWKFAHGGTAELNIEDLSEEVIKAAALHGLKQTISDAYAGEKNSELAQALAEARIECLLGGEWSGRAKGGSALSDLVQVLVGLTGKAEEQVKAIVAGLDDVGLKKMKKEPRVAAGLAKLQAERLAGKAEAAGTDSLLALLGGVQ